MVQGVHGKTSGNIHSTFVEERRAIDEKKGRRHCDHGKGREYRSWRFDNEAIVFRARTQAVHAVPPGGIQNCVHPPCSNTVRK